MLLVAGEKIAREVIGRAGTGVEMRHVADPYEALRELSSHPWPAILLAADEADFPDFCRACRRLQPRSRMVALCPPALEADVRQLVGSALDDYLLYPPSRDELRALDHPRGTKEQNTPAEPKPLEAFAVAGLTTEDYSRLVLATFSRKNLETCLAQIVSVRIGRPVGWADASSMPAGTEILLEAKDSPPRMMVAEKSEGPIAAKRFLAAVEHCLPALWSAAKRTETLHHLAITDHLTGAYNRRYFYHAADQILRQSAGRNVRVTLLLYDIDDFKSYNDTYGYAVGDEILCETAAVIRQVTRGHDIVARIGGDEFAVLFWDKDPPRSGDSRPPEDALVLSNRFLKALHTHQFSSLGPKAVGKLTISGGLANFPADGETCRDLLRRADQTLKTVKRSGKNAIRIVGS